MKKQFKSLALIALMVALVGCGETSSTVDLSSITSSTPASSEKSSPEEASSEKASEKESEKTPDPTPEPADEGIEETTVETTGTKTGNLDAKGEFYADYKDLDEEQVASKNLAIKIAAEGDVLLKNADDCLPLDAANENRVTLLGNHSYNLLTSGGGSGGGSINSNGVAYTSLTDSMADAGFIINSKVQEYNENVNAQTGGELEADPDDYPKAVVSTFNGFNDAAIVTISRTGAEAKDLATNNVTGHADEDDHYLQLDDNEVKLIHLAKAHFHKVIVILNSANIMEVPDLAEDKTDDNLGVDAILWVGHVGNNGAEAIGQILAGNVNPSGKTVDLWSRDFKNDPSFTNFASQSQNKNSDGSRMDAYFYTEDGVKTNYANVEYREGIYNGYKYYETKAADMGSTGESWYQQNVLYPFGFGLSYTSFEWELVNTKKNAVINSAVQTVTAQVKVTNTGEVAGKDVVEAYYSAPYTSGGIEKASNNLVQFAKTKELKPGESQVLTLQWVAQDMASYDWNDANNNGFQGYELEAGDYTISLNRDSHTPVLSVNRKIDNDIQITTDYISGKEITPIFSQDDDFNSTNESLLNNSISRATGLKQPESASVADRTITAALKAEYDDQDIYDHYELNESDPWYKKNVPASWNQGQIGVNPVLLSSLAGVPYTEPTTGPDGTVTAATDENSAKWDAFMNQLTWQELTDLVGISGTSANDAIGLLSSSDYSDGPVQMGGGTFWPCAPIVSATYNVDLAEKQGEMVGNEAMLKGKTGWKGPGMNTHRSNFGGRNFEYYSQDGVQGGLIAAAVVGGAVEKGTITVVKHCFLNEQETYRDVYGGVFTWATEQTIREQYIKPFQYAIERGHANGVMSSFNRVGKQVTAESYALHQYLLRDEFDFKGVTETDAWARNYVPINKMAVAGDDELLGTDSAYEPNSLDRGTWDETKKMVLVKAGPDATTDTVEDPSLYYGIRIRAQRKLYARVNSSYIKNSIPSGEVLELTADVGTQINKSVVSQYTSDVDLTLNTGATMPEGLTLNGTTVSGIATTAGDYDVSCTAVYNGWISQNVVLRIHVTSPIHYNGNSVSASTPIELTKDAAVTSTFDAPYYAYHNAVTFADGGNHFVCNWYVDSAGYNKVGTLDATAADTPTVDPADAVTNHVYGYTVTADIPGISFNKVNHSYSGMAGTGSYDVNDALEMTGTPTAAGTYEVKIELNVPAVNKFSSFIFIGPMFSPAMNMGAFEYKITETFTVTVA